MIDLLEKYSITDILIFLAFIALAAKEFFTFVDWSKKKIKEAGLEATLDEREEEKLNEYDERIKANKSKMSYLEKSINTSLEKIAQFEKDINQYSEENKEITNQLEKLNNNISLLLDSNKDIIKTTLTEKHHYYCYTKKYIDDYSLECCEKLFQHYKEEGGNSFIEHFMEDLRSLPQSASEEKRREKEDNG